MNAVSPVLTEPYLEALTDHLHYPSESTLARAYELGRTALADGVGILDVLAVHQVALGQCLLRATDGEQAAAIGQAAAEFLTEALAPMEMGLRGFQEANDSLRALNARLQEEVESRSGEILVANDRLRQADLQRRRLLRKLSQAQEEERKLLANALHDDTVQVLTAAMLRLDTLGQRASDPELAAGLRELSEQFTDAIRRCRHLLFVLRPPALDRDGLGSAVGELVHRADVETGMACTLTYACAADPGEEVSTAVFRVLDEAIRNAQKHSRASSLHVRISDLMHGVDVVCHDDGVGFDPRREDRAMPGHLGLASMRERVEIAGGTWELTSAPGNGTLIHFWIPLETGGTG